MYIHMIYIYIYVHVARERERERCIDSSKLPGRGGQPGGGARGAADLEAERRRARGLNII